MLGKEIGDNIIVCGHCGSFLQETTDIMGEETHGLEIGSLLLDRYKILKKIGKGGMGAVFLVRDNELDIDVAVKVLPPELCNDEASIESLKAEARIAIGLSHPNIMKLHQFETSWDTKFLVMEFVDGNDLSLLVEDGDVGRQSV